MNQGLEYIQKHWAWVIAAIGLIVAITSLVVNLINSRKTRKMFSYRVVTDTLLMGKASGIKGVKGKIEILYDGKPVDSMRLIEIELRNNGGKEIEVKDFHESVWIKFEEGTELFEAEVVHSSPKTFRPQIEQVANRVTLIPTLINSGDWLTIKVLVPNDLPLNIEVGGRISGVKEITKADLISDQMLPLSDLIVSLIVKEVMRTIFKA